VTGNTVGVTGPLQWAAGALFVLCFAVPLASGFFKFFWNDEIGRFQYANSSMLRVAAELISAARRDAQCQPGVVCPQSRARRPILWIFSIKSGN